MLILFEGGEAVGKTSMAKRLAAHLEEAGDERVEYLREPGVKANDRSVGEAIRNLLLDPEYRGMTSLTEFFLFQAARSQFVATILKPALDGKYTVVLDRFALSTMAYQIVGRRLPLAGCLSAIELATGGLIPDITFLLTCSYERSRARLKSGGKQLDRLEQEAEEFHRKVLIAYEDFARLLPAWNIHTIRTDELPQDDVFERVLGILRAEEGVIG